MSLNYIKINMKFNSISKYLFKNISLYVPFNIMINIVKYNKKYQSYLEVNLPLYKKLFLKKRLPIDYDGIGFDKLRAFLKEEFNSFTKNSDKKILKKIIEEIKEENKVDKIESDQYNYDFEYIKYNRNLTWSAFNQLICLKLYSDNYDLPTHCYPNFEQIIVPAGLFPNLKILYTDTNYILPASILKNLEEINIILYSQNKILFYNDINEEELNLTSLKNFYINRQMCRIKSKKKLNEKKNNKKYNYKIKFNLTNLEILSIIVELNEDLSFLADYFNLNYIYDSLTNVKKKDSLLTIFNEMKNKILYYQATEQIKKFILKVIIYEPNGTPCPKFKFIKLKNGKKYTFSMKNFSAKDGAFFHKCYKEIYKENEEGKKILKYFSNYNDIQTFHDILSLDNLNALKICDSGRNLDKNIFNKLFNIKDNNYSIQELYLDLNTKYINYDYLFKNIPKLKCLKRLNFINHVKNNKKLLTLIENVSKLPFLEKLKIEYFGKLSQKEINSIEKLIPFITIKDKDSYIKINKGYYDSDDEQPSSIESEV